jgi:hypothetical protein
MPLFTTASEVFSTLFIWLIGLVITEFLRKKFKLKFTVSHILYLWHSSFSLIYALYAQTHTADANGYFRRAMIGDVDFGIGTSFIDSFTHFFVSIFHISYLGTFFLFHIFGFIGLLAFYAALNQIVKNKTKFIKRLVLITIFLPSLNFWTSAIGKDSLIFMAIGLSLWASLKLKKRIWLIILSIAIIVMIRPHIAGTFIIALTISFTFDKNLPLIRRFILGILSLLAVSIMVPFALKYAGLSDISQGSNVIKYIEERQSHNQIGGGGIDISSMSLPSQLFTYTFRPLPIEAHSITALLASLDNLFLLFLFLLFLKGFYKNKKIYHTYNTTFITVFIIFTWMILAITTANLGIAIRQKWMFLPFLIFIFFLYIGNKKKGIYKNET